MWQSIEFQYSRETSSVQKMGVKQPESVCSKIKRRAKESLAVIVIQNKGLIIQVAILLILITVVFTIRNSKPLLTVHLESMSLMGIQTAISSALNTSNTTTSTDEYTGVDINDTLDYELPDE